MWVCLQPRLKLLCLCTWICIMHTFVFRFLAALSTTASRMSIHTFRKVLYVFIIVYLISLSHSNKTRILIFPPSFLPLEIHYTVQVAATYLKTACQTCDTWLLHYMQLNLVIMKYLTLEYFVFYCFAICPGRDVKKCEKILSWAILVNCPSAIANLALLWRELGKPEDSNWWPTIGSSCTSLLCFVMDFDGIGLNSWCEGLLCSLNLGFKNFAPKEPKYDTTKSVAT